MSKKNKNTGAVFVRGFLKTVLVLVLMIAVGFGSYYGVYWYCEKNNGGRIKERVDKLRKEQKGAETIYTAVIMDDTMSSGLEGIMLKIFNTGTKNTDYLMIPVNSKLNTAGNAYQEIKTENQAVPDTITIGEISSYISNESKCFEMTVKALEEICGVEDIAFYEAYNQKVLVSIANLISNQNITVPMTLTTKDTSGFEVAIQQGRQSLNGEQVYGLLQFAGYANGKVDQAKMAATYWYTYYQSVAALSKEDKEKFYQQYYRLVTSNDTEKIISNYVSDFMETTAPQYHFHLAEGTDDVDGWHLSTSQIRTLVSQIAAEEQAYITAQDMSEFEIQVQSSKGLVIDVYNSTIVTGLAGKWRDTLVNAGYQINQVGTDRTGTKDHAMIYVREAGRGLDLKAYFPQAEFITDPTLEGADIRIVLGTAESQ